jgi:SOS-response transcriptional repressor LexA
MRSSNKKVRKFPNIDQRVERARRALKMTQEQFAEHMGFSRNYISMIEKGRDPGPRFVKQLELIERGLLMSENVSPGPLLTKDEPAKSDRPMNYGGPYYGMTDWAPILSYAQAGLPIPHVHEGHEGPRVKTDCKDPNCYVLRVEGDSMEPKFEPGDLLVITPMLQAQNGDLVVAKFADESVVFKLFHNPQPGMIRLTSYNRELYPPLDRRAEDFLFIHPVHSVIRHFKDKGKYR